ncbi:MAG: porin [Bdellovibrio sp.]
MRWQLLLFGLVFGFSGVHAQGLETCGKLSVIEGDSCSNLKAKFDFSGCQEASALVEPTIKCTGSRAVLTYRGSLYNYRAVVVRKAEGWGRTSFVLKGKVWRQARDLGPQPPAQAVTVAAPQNPAPTPLDVVVAPALPERTVANSGVDSPALAQIVKSFEGLSFKGSVDLYYANNSNNPDPVTATPTAAAPQVQNKYHVFDYYHDDLQLSYARFQVQKVSGDLTTTLDLAYGPAMQAISGTKTDSGQIHVKQAIVAYKATEKLNLEFGRFATHLGYEVIETQDNWNSSRSVMFGYLIPFWHQGAKATYAISDNLSVMGLVANGWNNSYEDNKQKSYGGQIAWLPTDRLSLYLNVIAGNDLVPTNLNAATPNKNRAVYDLIATYKMTDKLSFAFNADQYQHDKYMATGAAVYSKYQFNDQWAVAGRIESIDDKDNLAMAEALPNGQRLSTYTLTVENKLTPGLTFRVEGRLDQSSEDVFTKDGTAKNSQSIALLGLTAGF